METARNDVMLREAKHLLLFVQVGDKQVPFGKLRAGFADAQNDTQGWIQE